MFALGRSISEAREIPLFSNYIDALVLVADTPQTVTIPTGASFVVFSANVDIWVSYNGTAGVPEATVDDGTAAELNPGVRRVKAGDTMTVVSESNGLVSLSYYA